MVLSKLVNKEGNSELTVEADDSLEWFEKEKYYVAKGNVVLKKDGLVLKANMIKADYLIEDDENVLNRIIAKEKVIITKAEVKATGQNISYDIKTKITIMSGSFQTFSSPSGYIESNKFIKLDNLKNEAVAEGSVKILLSNQTIIYADYVKADFTGKSKSLKKAFAKGNVIIENNQKGTKSIADFAIYNSLDEIIKLNGNVIIVNQDSTLKGSKGMTNLKTGISNIIGDPSKKRRVKGVFSPRK